ncbi:MAG: GDYXXLXY domain-containing protein [Deltaproteobacteria bacterium]|jgi:uncharacterized membrane-anchored protein
MKKSFVILAVLLQLIVLAYMAGEREYILRNGKVIHLRTAPVDPRDMFRGDYVRLNYEISRIPVNMLKGIDSAGDLKKGDKIYVSLKEGPNGLYELADAGLEKPAGGLYLAGRLPYPYRTLGVSNPIWIKYGIEAYFLEQGKGRAIEKRRGSWTDVQIPLEMEIAVGPGGKAAIKGYRWSPLGIGLTVLRGLRRNQQGQDQETPRSATVQLTLANTFDKPLAIVNLPDYCSFRLEPVPWARKQWSLAHDPCEDVLPSDADVITLAPEQRMRFDFEFSAERWLVEADGQIKQIGTLKGSEQFRLVYRPPDEAASRHLHQKDIIWHGYMPSRVFHGRGNID